MSIPSKTNHRFSFPRLSMLRRGTVVAFVAGAAMAAGVSTLAAEGGMPAWHQRGSASSPEAAAAHADKMLARLYRAVDATAAQQALIGPLVRQALADLRPLHQQVHGLHRQALQLLAQTPIDRAALEGSRVQAMQLADQASKRIVQLVGDVGDQLTPAQRQQLVEHLSKMHGARHHGG